jgi:hypothetical protein
MLHTRAAPPTVLVGRDSVEPTALADLPERLDRVSPYQQKGGFKPPLLGFAEQSNRLSDDVSPNPGHKQARA